MAILRSIGAVLAGVVFVVASATLTDYVLCKTVLPELATEHARPQVLALALAYRTLYGVVAGWITARLAPSRPMTHAMVLASIGLASEVAGLIVMWGVGSHWYPIALIVLTLPQTWLGARLAASRAA